MLNCRVLTEKLLKIKQNTYLLKIIIELNKLKTFDSGHFIGKSHFEEDYLVFQPMSKYFKMITNTLYILSWQSKGLSNENIDPPTIQIFLR